MFSSTNVKNTVCLRATLASLALMAIAACGSSSNEGGTTDSSCPNNVPQSCPAAIPSYANDVAPIIEASCSKCHGPGGVEAKVFPLQTYDQVFAKRQAVLSQVAACSMPQPGGGVTLDSNDRLTLLTWLVCNAPDN